MTTLYDSLFGTPTKSQLKKLYGKIDDPMKYNEGTIQMEDPDWVKKYDTGYGSISDIRTRSRLGTTSKRATLEATGMINPEQKMIISDDPSELMRRKELEGIAVKDDIYKEAERKYKPLTINDTIEVMQLGNRNAEYYENMLLAPLPSEYGGRILDPETSDYRFYIPASYIEDSESDLDPFGSFAITF